MENELNLALEYLMTGGARGKYTNLNMQGMEAMQTHVTYTLSVSVTVADPSRPLIIYTISDNQNPSLGSLVCRMPVGVSTRSVLDLYPDQLPTLLGLTDCPSNNVANLYYALNPWVAGGPLTPLTQFNSASVGMLPLALTDGAGYNCSQPNLLASFDRGATISNTVDALATIVEAGLNALQGSIYLGIVNETVQPKSLNKAGLAGYTQGYNGEFYTGIITDEVFAVAAPIGEIQYFTTANVSQVSQTRYLSQVSVIPNPAMTMADFGANVLPANQQGFPLFDALRNSTQPLYYNQTTFTCYLQWELYTLNSNHNDKCLVITVYSDWGNVDDDDNLQITSVAENQFIDVLPANHDQYLSDSCSFVASCPTQLPGKAIRPMPFFLIGIRIIAYIRVNDGTILPVDYELSQLKFNTRVGIQDLSMTGKTGASYIFFNDYAGPIEVINKMVYNVIPTSDQISLLGSYTEPPLHSSYGKIATEYLKAVLGRCQGYVGNKAQYETFVANIDVDRLYLTAPRGGHTLASMIASHSRDLPTEVPQHDAVAMYTASNLSKKIKKYGSHALKGVGKVATVLGNTAYQMALQAADQELAGATGMNFAQHQSYPSYHSYTASSNQVDMTNPSGYARRTMTSKYTASNVGERFNKFDPRLTRPAVCHTGLDPATVPGALSAALTHSIHTNAALRSVKNGSANVHEKEHIRNLLAVDGGIYHVGHSASNPFDEYYDSSMASSGVNPFDEFLSVAGKDETPALSSREPTVSIDSSYSTIISNTHGTVVKPNYSNAKSGNAYARIVEGLVTLGEGVGNFITVPDSELDNPLVLFVITTRKPMGHEHHVAKFWAEGGRVSYVADDGPASFSLRITGMLSILDEDLFNFCEALSFVHTLGVQLDGLYVELPSSYVGDPITGSSWHLAFVAACMGLPAGPILTGRVGRLGDVKTVGDVDIKILAASLARVKMPMAFPEQTVLESEDARRIVAASMLRMSRLEESANFSALPIKGVADLFSLVNTVFISCMTLGNSEMQSRKVKAKGLTTEQARAIKQEKRAETAERVRLKEEMAKFEKAKKDAAKSRVSANKVKVSNNVAAINYKGKYYDLNNIKDLPSEYGVYPIVPADYPDGVEDVEVSAFGLTGTIQVPVVVSVEKRPKAKASAAAPSRVKVTRVWHDEE